MESGRLVAYKGINYFVMDFTGRQSAERKAIIDECGRQVQAQPNKSVYVITNVKGASFDSDFINMLKLLAKNNEPHVIKGAVVGLSGLQQIAMMMISTFSNRTFEQFGTVEKAVEAFVADSISKKG